MADEEMVQSRRELLDYMKRVEERLDASAEQEEKKHPHQAQYGSQGKGGDAAVASVSADDAADPTAAMAFESPEDKQIFLNNVLEELKGNLFRVACDTSGSRILEKVITNVSLATAATIYERLEPDMTKALVDLNASHVIQALISKMQDASHGQPKNRSKAEHNGDNDPELLVPHLARLADTVIADMETYVRDDYASHIVRALLFVTAGLPGENRVLRSHASAAYRKAYKADTRVRNRQRNARVHSNKHRHAYVANTSASSSAAQNLKQRQQRQERMPVPKGLEEVRQRLLAAIRNSPQAQSWITCAKGGPVLQAAMDVVSTTHGRAACSALCRDVLGDALTETPREEVNETAATRLPLFLKDKTASHLMEKVIEDCSADLVHDLYVRGFRNKAVEMAVHPVTNFVVQRLLQHMGPQDCALLVEELMPHIEDILAEQRSSVVVEMLRAASRHGVSQRPLFKALLTAFHIPQDEVAQCLRLFLSLTTLDNHKELVASGEVKEDDVACTAIGSQIVQALLDFDAQVVTGLMAGFLRLGADRIAQLSRKRFGSFAVQKFFASAKVEPQQKKKVAKALAKHDSAIGSMACHPAGSHVIDALWAAVDVKQKQALADRMLEVENKLRESPQGRILIRNCRLQHFKWRREEWAQKQEANARKDKVFADIVGDGADGGADEQQDKEPEHEIDALFGKKGKSAKKKKKKSKDKKKQKRSNQDSSTGAGDADLSDSEDEGEGESGSGPAAAMRVPRKNKSKQFKDLAFIADALSAGKKKKKKKNKNKGEGGEKDMKETETAKEKEQENATMDVGSDAETQQKKQKKKKNKKQKKEQQQKQHEAAAAAAATQAESDAEDAGEPVRKKSKSEDAGAAKKGKEEKAKKEKRKKGKGSIKKKKKAKNATASD